MLSDILFKSFKFFIGAVFGLTMLMGQAYAAVEVNSADQSALESVRGLGPSKAKAILIERKKNGPFKDSNDLHSRVKGIGEKTVERLMRNGLTVNSKSAISNEKTTTRRSKQEKSESSEVSKAKKQKKQNKPS